jgi:hypothetical protein
MSDEHDPYYDHKAQRSGELWPAVTYAWIVLALTVVCAGIGQLTGVI